MISLFKMVTKHSTEGLSGAAKHKKAVVCLIEERQVWNKLCSGVSYSAIDWELDVS